MLNRISRSVSQAESVVMEVIWRRGPVSSEHVVQTLVSSTTWKAATVKTMLNRLLRKGLITAEKQGRRYLYSASLPKNQWLAAESESFLHRYFDGRIAPLVSHFSMHSKLSNSDVADLKRLIDEIGSET